MSTQQSAVEIVRDLLLAGGEGDYDARVLAAEIVDALSDAELLASEQLVDRADVRLIALAVVRDLDDAGLLIGEQP